MSSAVPLSPQAEELPVPGTGKGHPEAPRVELSEPRPPLRDTTLKTVSGFFKADFRGSGDAR